MKKTTILWLTLIFFAAIGVNAAVIDESLQMQLDQLSAEGTVDALVYFNYQADIASLNVQLKAEHATLAERNRRVILTLQEAATLTQPVVVDFLENLKSQGLIVSYRMFWIANVFNVEASRAGIEAIAARQDLEILYPNFPVEGIEPVKTEPADGLIASHEVGLDRINAPAAWAQGWTGAGRVVMNIDTGVDGNHPALSARFRGDVDSDGDVSESWFDPYSNYPTPRDLGGHGTHTMGTICGRTVAGDTIGVAIDAQWIAAGSIDRGGGIPRTVADAIASFEWAVDPDENPNTQDNPDAIGNSWGVTTSHGYPPCDPTFWMVIDNCEAAGSAVIFSAGNEGPSGNSLRRPADRGTTPYNCFSVGAVDGANSNLPIASFSSRGPSNCGPNGESVIKPEVVAPGVNVRSSIPGGGYALYSGTSMASPHVTGSVAVLRGVNPDLDVDTIKEILMSTAHDLPFNNPDGEDNTYGMGVIDIYEACLIAQSGYGFLAGRVTDSNNNGIGNALIQIVDSPRFTRADDEGYYGMGLPADTTYTVRASFFGYLPSEGQAAIIAEDTTTLDFTLQSAPSGSLHGRVIDSVDSTGISGASVEIADAPIDPVTTDNDGYYTMTNIPGGSTYTIRVRASGYGLGQGDVFIPVDGNPELNFALIPFESFENDDAGWEGAGVWQWGNPTSGPGEAYDGTNVWATVLGGQYPNNADDNLLTGFYLVQDDYAAISFYHWYNMENGWDGVNLSVSTDNGTTWQLITPTDGYDDDTVTGLDGEPGFTNTSDWALVEFELGSFVDQIISIRFRFGSDGSVTRDGYYLDAFVITGAIGWTGGDPHMTVTPPSFDIALDPGQTVDQTLTIGNNGDAPLTYSIRPVTLGGRLSGDIDRNGASDESAIDPNLDKFLTYERADGRLTVTYDGPKTSSSSQTGPPMTTDFGGPDEFGYIWYDSNEPNGPEFSWVDISGIGTPLTFSDDQNQGPFDFGFTMPYYEEFYSSINICSNGWLSFTSTNTSYLNQAIPTAALPNNLVAPFWDDLNPTEGGTIYFYTNNVDSAIVSYVDVPHYSYSGDGLYTFQAIFLANGNIVFQYGSMVGELASNTIGIENVDGLIGLQVAYNAPYVVSDMAVLFDFPVFWLFVNPMSGFALPEESTDHTVTFDATELGEGVYAGYLEINSNDPSNPTLAVPCTLSVGPIVGIDDYSNSIPTSFNLDQNYPNPFNPSTDISFALPVRSDVKLAVFDLLGRQVKQLSAGSLDAGYHTVTWDGKDNSGSSVSSGVYFYTIKAGEFEMTRKMVMLK